MKKKLGKTFNDAQKRLRETEAAYIRAQKAYEHWVQKITQEFKQKKAKKR